jgi:hypothetical protein
MHRIEKNSTVLHEAYMANVEKLNDEDTGNIGGNFDGHNYGQF